MAATNITFADGLSRVKTNASNEENFGIGGVYNLRARRSSKASSYDINKAALFTDEKAAPREDEDPGLRKEGDNKSKQVRHTLH
jgi:hypothetical protein